MTLGFNGLNGFNTLGLGAGTGMGMGTGYNVDSSYNYNVNQNTDSILNYNKDMTKINQASQSPINQYNVGGEMLSMAAFGGIGAVLGGAAKGARGGLIGAAAGAAIPLFSKLFS